MIVDHDEPMSDMSEPSDDSYSNEDGSCDDEHVCEEYDGESDIDDTRASELDENDLSDILGALRPGARGAGLLTSGDTDSVCSGSDQSFSPSPRTPTPELQEILEDHVSEVPPEASIKFSAIFT